MPSSALSWPRRSTSAETRRPIVASMARQRMNVVTKTNAPIAATPASWTWKLPPAAMQTARVPHTPAKRWAGIAPTTSSSLTVSRSLMPPVQMRPPMAPMMIAQ